MTVKDLIALNLFELKNAGDDSDMEREITRAFCCDLLSVAMGKAPAGCRIDNRNSWTATGKFVTIRAQNGRNLKQNPKGGSPHDLW